jgi:DNA-binding NarL/FixJ family response regulator
MSAPIDRGAKRLRILLADDNEPFRCHLRKLLHKNNDFEIVGEASNGEEAVRLALALKPDVVVMDIVMPRLNGIEATHRIKSESTSINVIALSGFGDDGIRRAMANAGASTFLLKDNAHHELPKILRLSTTHLA